MEATSYSQETGMVPDDVETKTVWLSVEASEPGEAVEAALEKLSEQIGGGLITVAEFDAVGPFSNQMRRWENFPPNAILWDVYLRWTTEWTL